MKNRKSLILVKLGGSLITDKKKPFTAKLDVIKRLAKEIHRARAKVDVKLIVGNGGGSFTHFVSKKYDLINGLKNSTSYKGLAQLQEATVRLNQIVVQELIKAGENAFTLHPSSFIFADTKQLNKVFLEPLLKLLTLDMLPVVYGGAIFDLQKGVIDFSTEKTLNFLALQLGKYYKIERVIYCSKTDGVYDHKGKTIAMIMTKDFPKVKKLIGKTEGIDVTGGMLHKVEESIKLAKSGIPSLIINGSRKNELLDVLLIGSHHGTLIK